jgi:hypothetical protein
MSDDFPTLSEVGEENARAYLRRKGERALAEWEEHQRFLANEYERL